MEEILQNFEIAQTIEKVSKVSEFWYQHEIYFEIYYLKQDAKGKQNEFQIFWKFLKMTSIQDFYFPISTNNL